MSRIYFHSPSMGDGELRGSERAHMGIVTGNLLVASIGPFSDYPSMPHWLRKLLPPSHWTLKSSPDFAETCKLFMRRQDENDGFVYNNQTLPMFDLALNTALFSGNDPIKLLARIHAQCEIHSYITGENRQWLADIIKRGRLYNIMRANQGWEEIIILLEARKDEPVVLSYSVCDQFPNRSCTDEDFSWGPSIDSYYDIPFNKKWEVCWEHLYNNHPDLELRPDSWDKFYFGNGLSGFDLYDLAEGKYEQQLLKDLFIEREESTIMQRKKKEK